MDLKIDLNLDAMDRYITKLDESRDILVNMNNDFVKKTDDTSEKISQMVREKQREVNELRRRVYEIQDEIRRAREASSKTSYSSTSGYSYSSGSVPSYLYTELHKVQEELNIKQEELNKMLELQQKFNSEATRISKKHYNDCEEYMYSLNNCVTNLDKALDFLTKAKEAI